MFELPELTTLAHQLNTTVRGKTVRGADLGNSPHAFVWYNRTPEEFGALATGRAVGEASCRGRWLFVPLEPGYVLLFGEIGGKLLFHAPGRTLPAKRHLAIAFEDGSALTAMTQMWGAYELHEQGLELERQYVRDMRPTPCDASFTFEYFETLVAGAAGEKRSAKGLLTQEQLVPGLVNAIAQDILFRAHLQPRHPLAALDVRQRRALFDAITIVVREAIDQGGRSDEVDLFGRPGGYVRIMSAVTAGSPCPACGTTIEKVQYLGGACYLCPRCQT